MAATALLKAPAWSRGARCGSGGGRDPLGGTTMGTARRCGSGWGRDPLGGTTMSTTNVAKAVGIMPARPPAVLENKKAMED